MADSLLPQTVLRGIGDKLYDKRKHAALEVEQVRAAGEALDAVALVCCCCNSHDLLPYLAWQAANQYHNLQIMKKLVAAGNDARIGAIITKLAEV
jgi:hypothetical protein